MGIGEGGAGWMGWGCMGRGKEGWVVVGVGYGSVWGKKRGCIDGFGWLGSVLWKG